MIRTLFQGGGKILFASEALNNLVRQGATTGNVLATILRGMLSSLLALDLKGDTVRITSASDTMVNPNPSNGAVARMSSDPDGSSVEEMEILRKWSFS